MTGKVITLQELMNAQVDAKKLELIMNEAPWIEITTRLGRKCYSISTVQALILELQKNIEIAAAARAGANGWTDLFVQTWSGRTQQEVNRDVVDIADYGGVPDNATENKNAWSRLTSGKQNYIATLAKGNHKITPPTPIDPNLRYSYYPPYAIAGLKHLQHGTESNPETSVGQITQVVRRVNKSSRNQPYEEQIGSALFDTKVKGSGDVNNPNLGGWVSGIFNMYK